MTSVAVKILKDHIVEGTFETGKEIGIKIDHTLTQDATGTMTYLQFEAMKLNRVKTELSISFIDHNMLQEDYKNADDHNYLATVAAKYGIKFSKPGNGISHQVYLERFAKPGKTLIGSDSHTPTAGGMGTIAIGTGGLDVAVAMGGGIFYLKTPKIVGIKLLGTLPDFVSAKDVILEVLRRIDVEGGVGKILEYFGPGVKGLSVPERAIICNMGAETGATTSIFSSDEVTREFLKFEEREDQWIEISDGSEDDFDEVIKINLSELVPLVAQPHSPGNVIAVSEVEGVEIDQVAIGSCTNSSLRDMLMVAELLKDKKIHPNISFGISFGSRQVLNHIAGNRALSDIISAGARILECSCGPCIGMGFSPRTNGVSVRTFNRNFEGRSGTKSAKIYLCSPETAVATAIFGKLTDPRKLEKYPRIKLPKTIEIDDSLILEPAVKPNNIEVIRGPNIAPLPEFQPLPDDLSVKVLIKLENNVTTDDILPAGTKVLPFRSNLPKISEFVFENIDPKFSTQALEVKKTGGGIIIGGENYGQGSSREHAALAPMFLGIKVILSKSFARIHRDNLINFGIIPLVFANHNDYKKLNRNDTIKIKGIRKILTEKISSFSMRNVTQNYDFEVKCDFSDHEKKILLAGGKLAYTIQMNR